MSSLPRRRDPTFWSVWFVGLLVFVLYRWTKAWASQALAAVHTRPLLDDWLRLSYVRNSGVAFGLGAGRGLPFAAITVLALGLVLVLAFQDRSRTWARSLALGLIVGGALGNLIDRVRWGSVIDFLDFGYRTNWWPVFNAADAAITVGVVAFAWTLLIAREPARPALEDRDAPTPLSGRAGGPGPAAGSGAR